MSAPLGVGADADWVFFFFFCFRFCGYQEDPRPVVSGAEHRKANAQDSFFLDCVERDNRPSGTED